MEQMAIDDRDPLSLMIAEEEEKAGGDKRYLQGVLCMEAIMTVGRFAKNHPEKWNTFEMHAKNPTATQRQLAAKRGVSQDTVRLHLTDARREIGHLIFNQKRKS